MASTEPHDIARLSCAFALILSNIMLVLPSAKYALIPWGRNLLAFLRWASREAGNLPSELLEAQLAKKRLQFMRRVLTVMEIPLFANIFIIGYQSWIGSPLWMSPIQDVSLFVAYFGVIVLKYFPRALEYAGAYGVYAFGMGCITLYVVGAHEKTIQMTTFHSSFPRFFCSTAVLNIPLAIAPNVLYLLFLGWSYHGATGIAIMPIDVPQLRDGNSGTIITSYMLLRDEIMRFCIIVSAAIILVKTATNEVKQELEAKAAKTEQSAARALLDQICDIAFELNDDLRMVEDFPRLAATLMLDPRRSLKGARLQQFMPKAEDQQEFEKRLLTPQPQEGCLADAFHVTLRDSVASNFRMEVFTVQFTALLGGRRYLVGLREHADVLPLVSDQLGGADGENSGFQRGDVGGGNSASGPRRQRGRNAPRYRRPSRVLAQGDVAACNSENSCSSGDSGSAQGSGGTPSECPLLNLAVREPSSPRTFESSTSSTRRSLQLCHLRETTLVAKEFCLFRAMYSWNVSMAQGVCCPMHATLEEMRCLVMRMIQLPCDKEFVPENLGQCPTCGILDKRLMPEHEQGLCAQMLKCSARRQAEHEDSRQRITAI